MAACFLSLFSCTSDSTFETNADLDDCIVTSATLGTLYRTMHIKKTNGEDSTYRAAVQGALYPLSIDQVNRRIFNPDSLPANTDVSRTVFSAFNASGSVGIRSLTQTDTDTIFVTTDSTDCSVTRQITVYAYNGSTKNTYDLQLNVHREEADSFVWREVLTDDVTLQSITGATRLLSDAENNLLVYAEKEGTPLLFKRTLSASWEETALPTGFQPSSVLKSSDNTHFYALSTNGILVSTDGFGWIEVGSDFMPDALVVAGTSLLIGEKDGKLYSSQDGGMTWTQDAADEPERLPVEGICGTVVPSRTDSRIEEFLIVGRDINDENVVWRRTVDLSGYYTFGWYYLPAAGSNTNCPLLTEPTLVNHDNSSLLIGKTDAVTLAPFYTSPDNGRTWLTSKIKAPALPVAETRSIAATVDKNHYIWILDTATGSLLKGRFNRQGWADYSGVYERSTKK